MKQRLGLAIVLFCLMPALFAQQKAKQNALSDLVSEIQVVIAANSLLNTLGDDGNVKQTFAESIRTEARAEIENFRLVDSWRSDNEYWVYYESEG